MIDRRLKLIAKGTLLLVTACASLCGCSSAPEPATAAATPTPAATATMPAPVVPTTASPTIPAPVATPALSNREEAIRGLGQNRVDYIEGFEQLGKVALQKLSTPIQSSADVTERRGTLQQAMAFYNRLPVPPEDVKADTLIRQGALEETISLRQMELSFQLKSQRGFDEAETHSNNANELYKRASYEMGRALKEGAAQLDAAGQQPAR